MRDKIVNVYPVICICGSMKFYSYMLVFAEFLTSLGYIVLMPYANKHNIEHKDDIEKIEHEKMLDDMHREKINMSSIVFVVTGGIGENYIGESTLGEIAYAESQYKRIVYSNDIVELTGISPTLPNAT